MCCDKSQWLLLMRNSDAAAGLALPALLPLCWVHSFTTTLSRGRAEKLTRKMERDFNAFYQSSEDMLNKSLNLEIWKNAVSAPTSGKMSCEKASLKLILDPDSNWLWTLGNHWDWVLVVAVSACGQRCQLTWTDRGHWTLNRAGEKIRQQGELRINGL